jgi:RNA polymerase sigma factor (sigma-70 family)
VREYGVRRSRDEFTDFYQTSWKACLQAVLASGESLESAEDLVADAFTKAWASWPQLRGHPAPRAWVVRTALNTRVSWWRRRWREFPLADYDLALPEAFSDLIDIDLLAAIRRLPMRQRQIIALRILADLDIETTSQQLGIAPGTVRAHLSRAVQTLRREFLPHDDKKESQCANTMR